MINQTLLIAILAAFISFVATPLALQLARRLNFIAYPSGNRWSREAVPLLGGVAIWLGLVISLVVFGRGSEWRELVAIVVGATLLGVLGVVDDRAGLPPRTKLVGQIVAALILVAGGLHTQLFIWPLLDYALTTFWVVGIVNAINFQDNMDGLAAGVSAMASGSFLLLALMNGQVLVASLAAALLGAALGYLLYNFQPAVIFMGDAGSMVLGFALAVLGIKLTFQGIPTTQTWMIPILVLAVPIFDMTLVVISRTRRGVSVMQGGVDHTSHRLVRLGLSHRRMLLALYTISIGFGLVAALITTTTVLIANLVAVTLGLAGIAALVVLEMLGALPAGTTPKPGMRVTVIGGGAELNALLPAAMQLGQRATLVLASPATPPHRDLSPETLRMALPHLAYNPRVVADLLALNPAQFDRQPLIERVNTANNGLFLTGQVVLYQPGDDVRAVELRKRTLQAIEATDLILIGGDLHENTLTALTTPEITAALRRSKRPRVLVAPNPTAALQTLAAAGVADIISHAVANHDATTGPWVTLPDVAQPHALADALGNIWLSRNRIQGAMPALIRNTE